MLSEGGSNAFTFCPGGWYDATTKKCLRCKSIAMTYDPHKKNCVLRDGYASEQFLMMDATLPRELREPCTNRSTINSTRSTCFGNGCYSPFHDNVSGTCVQKCDPLLGWIRDPRDPGTCRQDTGPFNFNVVEPSECPPYQINKNGKCFPCNNDEFYYQGKCVRTRAPAESDTRSYRFLNERTNASNFSLDYSTFVRYHNLAPVPMVPTPTFIPNTTASIALTTAPSPIIIAPASTTPAPVPASTTLTPTPVPDPPMITLTTTPSPIAPTPTSVPVTAAAFITSTPVPDPALVALPTAPSPIALAPTPVPVPASGTPAPAIVSNPVPIAPTRTSTPAIDPTTSPNSQSLVPVPTPVSTPSIPVHPPPATPGSFISSHNAPFEKRNFRTDDITPPDKGTLAYSFTEDRQNDSEEIYKPPAEEVTSTTSFFLWSWVCSVVLAVLAVLLYHRKG